jgi:predicted nucleotidyltransferase
MVGDDWIKVMIQRIVTQFAPKQVILFGSQARGDAGPNSDVDLLVVLAKVKDRRQETIRIRQALADLPIAKDIFIATPEDIRLRGNLVGSILRPALSEGKVLYERT